MAALGISKVKGKKSDETIDKKVHTVRMAMTMPIPDGFSLYITREQLCKIMLDYLYARSIRNRINHAAEQNNTTENLNKLLTEFGTDIAFRENIIIEQLKKSVEFISEITALSSAEQGESNAVSH